MRVLGIDPGRAGALALVESQAPERVLVVDMPVVTVRGKTLVAEDLLTEAVTRFAPDLACLEAVHAMPKQGVASMFSFGCSFGIARGVLAGLHIPRKLVQPLRWKRHFGISADKHAARLLATQLFPTCANLFTRRKDDGRAEAALLALYGALETPHARLAKSNLDSAPVWLA